MANPRWEWFDVDFLAPVVNARWEWFDLSWQNTPFVLRSAPFTGLLRSSYLVVGDTDEATVAGQWQRIPLAKQILPTNKLLTNYEYAPNVPISDSVTSITFPWGVTQVQLLAVKNLGPDSDLNVYWTPVGHDNAQTTTLSPGSILFFLETDLSQGISSLSLQSVSGITNADLLISG